MTKQISREKTILYCLYWQNWLKEIKQCLTTCINQLLSWIIKHTPYFEKEDCRRQSNSLPSSSTDAFSKDSHFGLQRRTWLPKSKIPAELRPFHFACWTVLGARSLKACSEHQYGPPNSSPAACVEDPLCWLVFNPAWKHYLITIKGKVEAIESCGCRNTYSPSPCTKHCMIPSLLQ